MKATVLLIGLGFASACHASTEDDWKARVQSGLQPYIDSHQNVGFMVGGIEQGQKFQLALGSSDLGISKPLHADSIFQIASVTKTFTSLLLAELVEEHRISLNDPISKFFPMISELQSGPVGAITLVQLSTHTSGLPRLPANMVITNYDDPYSDYTADLLIDSLKKQDLLPHPGPYPIQYSNMGAGLLGYILSRVTGESYSQLIQTRITEPLGMSHTGVTRNEKEVLASVPGYDEALGPAPFWNFLSSTVGLGGIFSSLSDMLNYLNAQLNPDQSVLGKAIALTHEPHARGSSQSVGVAPDSNLGLGWILTQRNGNDMIWHNGKVGGYASISAINQTTLEAIEVLSNTANSNFEGCVFNILLHLPCSPPS